MREPYTSQVRSGIPFEHQVADTYRALGYQVVHNTELSGQQVDLVARREVEGAPRLVLAIECKAHQGNVGNQDVHDFVAWVTGERQRGTITGGVMVAACGFTKEARAAGSGLEFITLLSWDELAASLFNVKRQLKDFVADYEQSAIYRDYIHLAVKPLPWADRWAQRVPEPSLDDLVDEWLTNDMDRLDHARSLFVVADFGAGKTTLLRYLQYRTARIYMAGEVARIPLFVPLREFRFSYDISSLLRASFREAYYRDIASELLWQSLRSGLFAVLLDGFDEMVERSDPERRAELFQELVPIIRSASPTVITSRPSYFVERGELKSLIDVLRVRELSLTGPTHPSGVSGKADRLRRALVGRHREARPGTSAFQQLDERAVEVIRLLPLDRDQIEAYLNTREDDLARAGATPQGLLRFIDRTYDLTDLATRPLLLTLILESVLEGALKADDTSAQLGPAGLYEVYTRTKLDLDLAKGPTRRAGLSLNSRRSLAEALAMQMYQAGVLEVEFERVASALIQEDADVQADVRRADLTIPQVSTDFATCSFVTLSDDGSCRFIHKSFRGFFVARTLKQHLKRGHALFDTPLEWEVLYFLGGFAPTQAHVGEELWASFKNRATDAVLRRNLLVAFLYTRPDHDSRRIADAEITDAEFGRLYFARGRMTNVAWRRCTIRRLHVVEPAWKDVTFDDVHASEVELHDGSTLLTMESSTVEALTVAGGSADVRTSDSTIHDARLTRTTAHLELSSSVVQHMEVVDTAVTVAEASPDGRGVIESLTMQRARVSIAREALGKCQAEDSILRLSGTERGLADCDLRRCLIGVAAPDGLRPAQPLERSLSVDPQSVIIDVSPYLLSLLRCGVFGSLAAASARLMADVSTQCWGVVDGGATIDDILGTSSDGCRWGDVLVVKSDWYRREAAPGGRLSTVAVIADLFASDAAPTELPELLDAAQGEWRQVLDDPWPRYQKK
jgi:hypothetical protein